MGTVKKASGVTLTSGFRALIMAEKLAGGPLVVRSEGDVHVDPTDVSRGIYVTGFQAARKPDDIIVRRKDDGGDIDSVFISRRGDAVIAFDDTEGRMFVIN